MIWCVCGLLSTVNAELKPDQMRELAEIRKQIKAKRARWKAGETSVLRLSREERRRLCGLLIPQGPVIQAQHETDMEGGITSPYSPGEGIDWRNENVITPVKNQMACGGCWSFAFVAALESLLLIHEECPDPDSCDLSEQFVISCDTSSQGCCGTYSMRYPYDFLKYYGTRM